MYIIYNKDGSIKKKNFAEFIQKGNNNANFIFVGIDGLDLTDYSCYATFELPNGELGGPVAGVPIVEFSDELPYSGYNIPVTAEMTQYEGQVKLSLHIENSQGAVMYTYPVILVINDATAAPDETKISLSQYQALLNVINSKAFPTSNLFFTVVDDISAIPEIEWNTYSKGKIFYDKATKKYFIKNVEGTYDAYNLPVFGSPILSDTNDITLIGTTKKVGMRAVDGNNTDVPLGQFNVYQDPSRPGSYLAHMFAKGSGSGYYGVKVGEGGIKYEYPTTDSTDPSNPVVTQHEEPIDQLNLVTILNNDTSGTFNETELDKLNKSKCFISRNSHLFVPVNYLITQINPIRSSKTFICINRTETLLDTSYFTLEIELISVSESGAWTYTKKTDKIYPKSYVDTALATKQNALTFDTTPTADSDNPVTSGGIKDYVDTVVSGAVRFKGTVADLTELNAIQNPAQGDMYWVTSESSYYIWNGSSWSKTGGAVDLSNYVDKTSNQTISATKTFTSGIETSQVKSNSAGLTLKSNYDFSFVVGSSTLFSLSSSEGARFTTDVCGSANATYDLGSSSRKWKDLYLYGTIYLGLNNLPISTNGSYITIGGGGLIPSSSSESLGVASNRWSSVCTDKIDFSNASTTTYGEITVGLHSIDFKLSITGTLETLLKLYVEERTGQTPLYHAIFDTDIVRPSYDGQYAGDLGSSDYRWKDLYLSGNLVNGSKSVSVSEIYDKVHEEIVNSITITSGTSGTLTQEEVDVLVNAGSQAKIYYGSVTQKVYDLASDQEISASEHVLTFIKEDDVEYVAAYQRYEIKKSIITVSTLNGAWSKTDTNIALNTGRGISIVDIALSVSLDVTNTGTLTQTQCDTLSADDASIIRLTTTTQTTSVYTFRRDRKYENSNKMYYSCFVGDYHYQIVIDTSTLAWSMTLTVENYTLNISDSSFSSNQLSISDSNARYQLENNPHMLIGLEIGGGGKNFFHRVSGNDSELYRNFRYESFSSTGITITLLQYNKNTHVITKVVNTYLFQS